MLMIFLYLFIGLVNVCVSQGPISHVYSVADMKASLPCDVTPPTYTDATVLVLWYKDMGDMPIYSYDARSRPGSHSKSYGAFGERAYFRTITHPASLTIENIKESDEGMYRCRVDFLTSPTRNSQVNLSVIIPPNQPKIYDAMGKELNGIAGPYSEGVSVTLSCIALGGKPVAEVTWWRDGTLVDNSYEIMSNEEGSQNVMTLNSVSRSELHTMFRCQAGNNNISDPLIATVQVEMFFGPIEVKLLGMNKPISSSHDVDIVCQSIGSRPPAEISWYKDGHLLKSTKEEISLNGNISTSTLRFSGTHLDDGKSLTCRAQNSKVDASALEDSWKLQVFYIPILKLALGSKLNGDDVREGSDVYFECSIQASPWVYKVLWIHNGKMVHHNATAGIIMSNQSLVLQKVKKWLQGEYICSATNTEGEGRSNPVHLSIKYPPFCDAREEVVYGIGAGEEAQIKCPVESNPPGRKFFWVLNGTANTIAMPQGESMTKSTTDNLLQYTPLSPFHYGSLICWAINDMGEQKEPCLVHLRPAGNFVYIVTVCDARKFDGNIFLYKFKQVTPHENEDYQRALGRPEVPFNCSGRNATFDSIRISCTEGFDGGLPQMFYMEVLDGKSPQLLSNHSSIKPAFIIRNLRPGQVIKAYIYAGNGKGTSRKLLLQLRTISKPPEHEKRIQFQYSFLIAAIVGTVLFIAFITLVVLAACRLRKRSENCQEHNQRPKSSSSFDDKTAKDNSSSDDNNPDIIPNKMEVSLQEYNPGSVTSSTQTGPGGDSSSLGQFPQVRVVPKLNQTFGPGPGAHSCSEYPCYCEGFVCCSQDRNQVFEMYVPRRDERLLQYGETSCTLDKRTIQPNSHEPVCSVSPDVHVGQREKNLSATIYGTINHSKKLNNIGPIDGHNCVATLTQKEVVSVKTPFLINPNQESCV